MAQARSPVFDNVDPALLRLIQSFQYGGPYKSRITSGYREGDPRFHGKGRALDVELYDPKTGAALNNYQDASTFGSYQEYANALYQYALQSDPELAKQLRWGGYFSGDKGKYGALDLMHFDTAGDVGMAGGSWQGGLTPEQAKIWGLQTGGGVGGYGGGEQQGPAFTGKTDYTPEQRRNAIASIESAGSGDYAALGKPIGGPHGGDRAYGRYQIMGANIPAWSKEVLGRSVTPQEFMADPKIQDAIFDKKFGDYVRKYGEENAAQAWFGGEGSIGMTKLEDPNGLNIGGYGKKYLEALGQAQGPVTDAPAGLGGAGGGAIDPATAPATDPTKKSFAKTLFGSLGDIGAAAGAPQKAPTSKAVNFFQPNAGPTQSQTMTVADTRAQDDLRAQLAQRMALLSSGKLA
jgi:hypothetical protein